MALRERKVVVLERILLLYYEHPYPVIYIVFFNTAYYIMQIQLKNQRPLVIRISILSTFGPRNDSIRLILMFAWQFV